MSEIENQRFICLHGVEVKRVRLNDGFLYFKEDCFHQEYGLIRKSQIHKIHIIYNIYSCSVGRITRLNKRQLLYVCLLGNETRYIAVPFSLESCGIADHIMQFDNFKEIFDDNFHEEIDPYNNKHKLTHKEVYYMSEKDVLAIKGVGKAAIKYMSRELERLFSLKWP